MKHLLVAAALLLTACQPSQAAHDRARPALPIRTANIADQGQLEVSDGDWLMHFAVDGDIDTWWSADDFAPQWIEIDFGLPRLVTRIEVSFSQVRPGPSSCRIMGKRNGETVFWHRVDSSEVSDGHLFSLKVDPAKNIDTVRVLTTRHEGWVAIRELRVLATLPESVSVAASGLTEPVFLTHANDNSGRLFVLEKEGRIRIIENGRVAATPFLDIGARVDTSFYNGLLGLAFSPAYSSNGYFYVSYVSTDKQNRVSRFSVGPDPGIADPDSEEVILEFHLPGTIHSVGTLSFGPLDGYLYVAAGDGRYSYLPDLSQDAQDPGKFLGKILRIDVESGARPYAIPPDNPFLSMPGYAPEIWALGLRNPWGIAFDQKTGDLYIPDTGQTKFEEINWQAAHHGGGQNYGWPIYEGHESPDAIDTVSELVWPVAVHGRDSSCAIVGGAVHAEGFVYADFCTGQLWTLRQQGSGQWRSIPFAIVNVPISSIGIGEDGTLYALGYADGRLYRIMPQNDAP